MASSPPKAPAPAELTAAMERALIHELRLEWRTINGGHFKGALAPVAIELSRVASRLGHWARATRTIAISRHLVLTHPWTVVVEVLKHEMAHQYAHEVLGAVDEAAHGRAFRQVCERLGIDAASSGIPRASRAEDEASETDRAAARVVGRIAKLLALAESPNVHEAEAAMAAAQRLMLKHNIEVAAHELDYESRSLGTPSGRVEESQRILAGLLARHFFVEVIWIPSYRPLEGKRGSVLEACGTHANLDMAEYVHSFLLHACERLWVDHKRAAHVTSNRERRTFQSGVMTGFASKLAAETKRHRTEGLVWVKDANAEAYFRKRHPHIRNVRYGASPKNDAWHHGRAAGEKLVLRRGVSEGAVRRGRLLA